MEIIYRELRKKDCEAVKAILNESFGLHRYVGDKRVLESFLNLYLYSCLAEQTFQYVAEENGKVIGVIMGQAKSAYHAVAHLKHIVRMVIYGVKMRIQSAWYGCDMQDYKRMHQIYRQLLRDSEQTFGGVLTLFAVTEACRGKGVGSVLLHHFLDYLYRHEVDSIYLYTDSCCSYPFYERHGFQRLGQKSMTLTRDGRLTELDIFLYGLA